MQIKKTNETPTKSNVVVTQDGHRLVMLIDTADLIKKDGLNYFSTYEGAMAYFFDNPYERKHNSVLIKYDKSEIVMTIPQLLLHLIFWRANVIFQIKITDDHIYRDLSNPSSKTFSNIIEKITQMLVESEEAVTPQICECIASIKENLSVLAQNYSSIQCNTISLYDIIQFKNRNKDFNRLLNTKLSKDKTIKETEMIMSECQKQLMDTINTDKMNCLYPYSKSGRVKSAQLTQLLCCVGTRPDIDKTILPWPVERGYIHGLQNAAEYFSETITARDAMMTKNDSLPRSGLLSREITRLTSNIYINYNIEDCGNDYYLNYLVENEDYLRMVKGKFYFDEDSGKEKEITMRDKHLIGKVIKLRTLITCRCKDGVCKKCVGTVNIRLRGTRLGTLPSIKSINPLSQKALSAKHFLGTKSIAITNEALDKYCYSDGMDFFIKSEFINKKQLYIVVNSDDIEDLIYSSVDIEDDSIDTTVPLEYVAIRDNGVDHVIENEGMRISLSDAIIQNKNIFIEDKDSDYVLIPISKIDCDQPVFSAILDTEEISKYLNSLLSTIDRLSISKYETFDQLMDDMNHIIYTSGFVNNIIHSECIIRSMIRDAYDDRKLPDFSNHDVKYKLLKVSSAIEKKDMYTALSYQGLRRLFKTLSIRQRYGTSLYDPFFRIGDLY
jgi:hypothetical protein